MLNYSKKKIQPEENPLSSEKATISKGIPTKGNPVAAENETPQYSPEQEQAINSRINEIESQRIEFMRKRPDFDMKAEMENKDFVNYIWINGLTVEDAYFLTHKDEIINEGIQQALNQVMTRHGRISENGAGKNSPAAFKKNPKDMSDEEIDKIIERVQNGEKVKF